MTDQEVAGIIKEHMSAHGTSFKEYKFKDISVAYRDTIHTCVLVWNGTFICYCSLKSVPPEEIQYLTHVRQIDVRFPIDDCSWLKRMEYVEILNIDVCGQAFPESWACQKTLRKLRVTFPKEGAARSFPPSFRQFRKLQEISVESLFYPIQLPDWLHEFPDMQTLSLENCQLESIPYSMVKTGLDFVMENVRWRKNGIRFAGVRLQHGDLQLFAQSRETIEQYYRAQRNRTASRECKIIFLGDGSVGKSSLIEQILYNRFHEGHLPTEGIYISTWDTSIGQEDIRLKILDFGGQEIMHAMHRCFMTPRTVYVVVCASRNDTEIELAAARWLDSVHTYAPDCQVILALNKIDQNEKVQVNQRALSKRNPNLRRALHVSAKKPEMGNGVAAIVKEIKDAVIECLNQISENADMLGLKRELENMREDYISAEQYRKLCGKYHINETKAQKEALLWLRDLGVAYFYEDESLSVALEGIRVLNPAWLTNGIYRLILHTPDGGFLSHKLIKETLFNSYDETVRADSAYSAQETEFVLHVMRGFEISHGIGNGIEMIPMKMNKTPPEAAFRFPRDDALHLRWKADYLPSSVVHRLMIRKADELDYSCVWRMGGRFHKKGGFRAGRVEWEHSGRIYYRGRRLPVLYGGISERSYKNTGCAENHR